MGYYEIGIDSFTSNSYEIKSFEGKLMNKLGKKKKEKERGTINFSGLFLPYDKLSNTIYNTDGLLKNIIENVIDDELASSFVALFLNNESFLRDMFKQSFKYEVGRTLSSEQLFRTDSFSTRLMKNASSLIGKKWLKTILMNPVNHVLSIKKSVEVDPTKMTENDNLKDNIAALNTSINLFLTTIFEEFKKAPHQLKMIANEMAKAVEEKFPDKKIQAIGGFMFLRFICPAISTPEVHGLCKSIHDHTKRHFLLIAKVIQAVINNVPFVQKDPYLKDFNHFVTDYQSIIERHFNDFIKEEHVNDESKVVISNKHLAEKFKYLTNFLISGKLKVENDDIKKKLDEIMPTIKAYNHALSFSNMKRTEKEKKKKK